jgi:hypothetical protein
MRTEVLSASTASNVRGNIVEPLSGTILTGLRFTGGVQSASSLQALVIHVMVLCVQFSK